MVYKVFLTFFILFFNISFNAHSKSNIDIRKFEQNKPTQFKNIEFLGENGQKYRISDFKDKIVVLNIWATWCKPCVVEMPLLSELKDKLDKNDIEVITLSVDFVGIGMIKKFYEQAGITNLDIYHDSKATIFRELKLRALPTTFILNKEGMQISKILGELDWSSENTLNYLVELSNK